MRPKLTNSGEVIDGGYGGAERQVSLSEQQQQVTGALCRGTQQC